jgi:general secretion pathway protein L
MSTLVLHLPWRAMVAPPNTATRPADGHQATRHGTAAASTLPAVGRASEIVALVPVRALSWQRVTLPRGVGPNSPRLRNVPGLLEDRLLDDPASCISRWSLAHAPAPAPVAVCDRAWLRAHCRPWRPRAAPWPHRARARPGATDAVLVLHLPRRRPAGRHPRPHQGAVLLPLAAASMASGLDADPPPPLVAEPAVAALAEQAPAAAPNCKPNRTRPARSAQPWDLAQMDLASSGRTRTLAQGRAWQANCCARPNGAPPAWGAAVLLLAHPAGLNAWAWQERQMLAAKKAAAHNALTQTFPQVKVVVDAPCRWNANWPSCAGRGACRATWRFARRRRPGPARTGTAQRHRLWCRRTAPQGPEPDRDRPGRRPPVPAPPATSCAWKTAP